MAAHERQTKEDVSKRRNKFMNPNELLAAKVRTEVFDAIPFGGGLLHDRIAAIERTVQQLEGAMLCVIREQRKINTRLRASKKA